MSETASFHFCQLCDYKSKWEYNLKRHIESKHTTHNGSKGVSKGSKSTSNDSESVSKGSESVIKGSNMIIGPETIASIIQQFLSTQEGRVIVQQLLNTTSTSEVQEVTNSKQCDKCLHIFTQRHSLLKHYANCKGIVNKCQCIYCYKIFQNVRMKNNHYRTCSAKKQYDANTKKASEDPTIDVESTSFDKTNNTEVNNQTIINANTTNNNTTNNNTTNNNTTNIQNNNTTNNNITNIMVFKENEPLLFDHITKQSLKKIIQLPNFDDVVKAFGEEVWKRKENQCVKKTNMRSSTSSVHVGNNVWESRTDKLVYPPLICNIVITLGEVTESHNFTIQKHQLQHSEDFTCNGEHGTDNEPKEAAFVKKMFKDTIDNVKQIIYNSTT